MFNCIGIYLGVCSALESYQLQMDYANSLPENEKNDY